MTRMTEDDISFDATRKIGEKVHEALVLLHGSTPETFEKVQEATVVLECYLMDLLPVLPENQGTPKETT